MAKPRIQFSLKTLLIITVLVSAALGTVVTVAVAVQKLLRLRHEELIVICALTDGRNASEQESKEEIVVPGSFALSFNGEFDYIIYERPKNPAAEATEKLVNLHFRLANSGGKTSCEITIKGGRDSQAVVNELREPLQIQGLAVSVKESN